MNKASGARGYCSEIAAAMHETIEGFHRAGVVSKTTLKAFDDSSLLPVDTMTADDIRALREREAVSQPIFAAYLNVSRNLVSDWERGKKRPGGPALRLLSIVKKGGLAAVA